MESKEYLSRLIDAGAQVVPMDDGTVDVVGPLMTVDEFAAELNWLQSPVLDGIHVRKQWQLLWTPKMMSPAVALLVLVVFLAVGFTLGR